LIASCLERLCSQYVAPGLVRVSLLARCDSSLVLENGTRDLHLISVVSKCDCLVCVDLAGAFGVLHQQMHSVLLVSEDDGFGGGDGDSGRHGF
jgi:hypothetical protein